MFATLPVIGTHLGESFFRGQPMKGTPGTPADEKHPSQPLDRDASHSRFLTAVYWRNRRSRFVDDIPAEFITLFTTIV